MSQFMRVDRDRFSAYLVEVRDETVESGLVFLEAHFIAQDSSSGVRQVHLHASHELSLLQDFVHTK